MKKIGIVASILFVTIPFFVSNPARAYVSPGKPAGFVNDFANIISADEKANLETILSNYEKQSGNQIAVVTIVSLGDETVESYAVALFKEWGIGVKGKDNGLLLLVALDDRKMRIEVGYGLEPYMTDAQASSIIRNILTPNFKEGKYSEGISQAVTAMINVLNGQVDAIPENKVSFPNFEWLFWGVFIAIWWGTSVLGRSKSWWLGGVLGGIAGVIFGIVYSSLVVGGVLTVFLCILGLIFDFLVSKSYQSSLKKGGKHVWWIGGGGSSGGFGGSGGGGFGGFGGGGSGGGGSSGGW